MKSMVHTDSSNSPPDSFKTPASGTENTLPLIEETAQIELVEVDKGGWRITKKVHVTDQLIDEELRNFQVHVERRPMGTQLKGTEIPQPRYEGNTLVIPVVEEVLVTEKRLMLVEEVHITGVHGTHHQPQRVSLRKDAVSIERLAPQGAQTANEHQPPVASQSTGISPAVKGSKGVKDEFSDRGNF